ncbi:MAG: acyl-[acyl-carrier-protein]--UDP-N-acetylglucosamine O-acyltransferase [Chlamydiales bacterium 38-26]|nr:acyl-ACP--UDP-N-acetylglucosamine O-acyltransferase [Chlamydiales bacterium]OJV07799.1 MAG: acyl-[acyl-carrier-protein]--UDP-N-acetylglucosamine O-acyltransferase [Chlamydiales bacterium 38-26]
MPNQIHSTAIIHPHAILGDNVTVEAYAIINSPHIVIENNVTIKAHAYIDGYTTVGDGSIIYPFASIGTRPQDLKYKGENTYVKIGKRCQIREYVTINSSTGENESVEVGDDCYIMTSCHIAHNCKLGEHVIMSNGVQLAGHITVGDYAIIGGMTGVHQFVRIGSYAMVGGFCPIHYDIPPYLVGGQSPFKFGGVNTVGLKRHGFSLKTRSELFKAFKWIFRSPLTLSEGLKKIEDELEPLPEIKEFVDFCRSSKRGLMEKRNVDRTHYHKTKELDDNHEE